MTGSAAAVSEVLASSDKVAFWFRVRARCLIFTIGLVNMAFVQIASQNGLHTFLPPGQEVMVDYAKGAFGPSWIWVILGGIGYGFSLPLFLALIMPTDTYVIRVACMVFLFFAGVCPWMTCLPTALTNVQCEAATAAEAALLNTTSTTGGTFEPIIDGKTRKDICVSEVISWAFGTLFCFAASVYQVTTLRLTRRRGRCGFAMTPRAALNRSWTTMRMVNGAFVLAGVVRLVITVSLIGNVFFSTLEFRHLLCGFIGTFLASVLWTPRFRRNLLAWIFNGSNSAAQRKEAKAAAAIAAMVGKLGRGRALSLARENFRALSVATLDVTDLNSNTDAHDLFKRTSKAKLGEVDAFMSHSWSDAGAPKFSMLKSWADQNDVTSLWLDKACINQDRIEESLACLPVFLSGCKKLLIIAGPSYVTRLWCILELYTFIRMGGTLKRIQFLPIPSSATDASETLINAASDVSAADYFASFDVRHARCWQKDAEQHLLGVIEAGFGSFDSFNNAVRSIFVTGDKQDDSRRTFVEQLTAGTNQKAESSQFSLVSPPRVKPKPMAHGERRVTRELDDSDDDDEEALTDEQKKRMNENRMKALGNEV